MQYKVKKVAFNIFLKVEWKLCNDEKNFMFSHERKSFNIFPSTLFSPEIKKRKMLSYQDVSSEKWSLPGSSVVVDAAVVVVSSAFNDLKWMTIKISKMRKPFDGKLLSFIAKVFLCRDKTAEWMNGWILLCTFNRISHMQITICLVSKSRKRFIVFGWCFCLRLAFHITLDTVIINISHSQHAYILVKISE